MSAFPITKPEIRLAMLGMVEGNGHPYSWSIIFNGGYDRAALDKCPYPGIRDYIVKQPPETLGIAGARVTHVWTDDPADAADVSRVSLVPNVVARAEDVIGHVDAVLVATDKGFEHVERARPFIEAGLPVFIDKPLCDNLDDLRVFDRWVAEGRPLISSSAMRYAKEYVPYHRATHALGSLRHIGVTMAKSWEAYGIHALESVYPIVGPGFVSVQNLGSDTNNIVHLVHRDGVDVLIQTTRDMYGGFGMVTLAGTAGGLQLRFSDTYHAFRTQLVGFVDYLRTGTPPVPWAETRELMLLVIAGIRSREAGGRKIFLSELEQA
jgi:predicted dehydrogenase